MALVIHPSDRTTAFLQSVYGGLRDVTVLTQSSTPEEIRKAVHHLPRGERLLALGHGSAVGLYSRDGDSGPFTRIILGHGHSYYLRGRTDIVGIWCHADEFARKEHLHGLFSGMIISDIEEAADCGVVTSEEELDRENPLLASRLGMLLGSGIPLRDIPAIMPELDTGRTELTEFNYRNFHFL